MAVIQRDITTPTQRAKEAKAKEIERARIDEASAKQFADLYNKNKELVINRLKEKFADDPEGYATNLTTLSKMSERDRIMSIFELSDKIKIKQLEQTDPLFNEATAFAVGFDESAFFGGGGELIDLYSDEAEERRRLLAKAFPKSEIAGEVGGFLTPLLGQIGAIAKFGRASKVVKGASPGAALFEGAVSASARARAGLSRYVDDFIKLKKTDSKIQSAIKGVSKRAGRTADVAVGGAAFEGTKALVKEAGDVAEGQDFDALQVVEQSAEGALGGAIFGAGFEALGGAAKALRSAGRASVRKGASLFLGKPIKYQIENIEAVRKAYQETPEAVLGKASQDISKTVDSVERTLLGIEARSKDRLVKAVEEQSAGIKKQLQDTANDLIVASESLRKAKIEDVAKAGKNLYQTAENTLSRVNRNYGKQINEIVATSQARIDPVPIIDKVESVLKQRGAMTNAGKPLPNSTFAEQNRSLYSTLVDEWRRIGGEARAAGGNPGTLNLKDAIETKKTFGRLGNFDSGKVTAEEGIFNSLYGTLRRSTEKAETRLVDLNNTYTNNRRVIDKFRNTLGKNEQQVASALDRQVYNTKDVFIKEALDGLGEISEEAALQIQKVTPLQEQLSLLKKFKNNPKSVFNELRGAYVRGDDALKTRLEDIASESPQLQRILKTAETQGMALREVADQKAIREALKNPEFESRLLTARPDLQLSLNAIKQAQAQRSLIRETFPANQRSLENRVSRQNFGETQAEQRSIGAVQRRAPEIEAPLKQAEVGRATQRLQTTEGIEQSAIVERLPVVGPVLFGIRKSLTPSAARLINRMGRASEGTNKALMGAVTENLQGTADFSRQQIDQLLKAVGTEMTIKLYIQAGGAEDVGQAFDRIGKDFE